MPVLVKVYPKNNSYKRETYLNNNPFIYERKIGDLRACIFIG